MLVYPTLVVALIGAVPQWVDRGLAIATNAKTESFAKADRQKDLWQRNLSCAALPFNWYANPDNVRIDATICDSGDIFIRAATPQNEQFYHWVPVEDVVKAKTGDARPAIQAALQSQETGLLIQAVFQPTGDFAAGYTPVQYNVAVICQRFIDGRHILRHLRTPQGCFDEVVDTFNGAVVRRAPTMCRASC